MNSYASPKYIDNDSDLATFATSIAGSRVLAIDTEFIREKTYYPNLCLIQLATDDEVAIIDPLGVTDLTPLIPIITDPDTVKLVHAGAQDLEIIYRELGVLPTSIFDVQIAASLLGQTQQAGLASLLSTFLGINIKKSDSFTDWARRPLVDSQIVYAAEDVIYLPKLFDVMTKKLEEMGRLDWLEEDFKALCMPTRYEEDPYLRYKRLKRGNQLNRKQSAAAKEVAAWRELEAQKRDIPRKWILSDEQIVESCKREPNNIDELFLVRGVKNCLSTRDARIVIQLMKKAFNDNPNNWPKQDVATTPEKNVDSAVDLMTALVRIRSKEEDIAMQTLASHSDLTLLARGYYDETPVLKGWRKKIIGDDLLKLLEGKILLKLDDGEISIVRN